MDDKPLAIAPASQIIGYDAGSSESRNGFSRCLQNVINTFEHITGSIKMLPHRLTGRDVYQQKLFSEPDFTDF